MKLGNAAGALICWVSWALLASACDKEGQIGGPGAGGAPMAGPDGPNAGETAQVEARPINPAPQPGPSSELPPPTPALDDGMGSVVSSECPLDRPVLEQASPATYAIVFRALNPANEVVPVFTATAFAVGPNLLATNSHVTRGLEEMMGQTAYEDVVAVEAGTGTVVPLALAINNPAFTGNPLAEPDVGLLTTGATLPVVLALAPPNGVTGVGVSDEVFVVGFPGDVNEFVPTIPGETIPQATALPGNVTALRNFDPTVPVTETTTDIIQHDAATSPGMSGSPMLHCGVVVGVNNAGTIKQILTPDANGNVLVDRVAAASNNFAIDVKHLHGLISEFQAGRLSTVDLNSHPTPVPPPPSEPPPSEPTPTTELCRDTCFYAEDQECDDGGPGSSNGICSLGSDCTDCGPRMSAAAPPGGGAPLASDWLVFTDPATGDACDTVNGADFEAIVILPSRELMLVNVFDPSGQVVGTDVLVPGVTVDDVGNFAADGVLTGDVLAFAPDGDGSNRLWVFQPDGTLVYSFEARAGLTPGLRTNVRCSACGALDRAPPQLCP